jgi:hypothetical protein
MTLSVRERATVLAALRYWQRDLKEGDDVPLFELFEDATPLTAEEIDDLCERFPGGST